MSTALLLLAAADWGHAYETTLPLRGDAFESGVYLRSRGHGDTEYGNPGFPIDFHAAEWDGANWQGGNGGSTNEDQFIFGAPLYAPEDLWVIACWTTAPDRSAPGADYPFANFDFDGDGDADGGQPVGAGNYVQTVNAAGTHQLHFMHLQNDSIPSSVCPLPAGRDLFDVTTTNGVAMWGSDGWPDDLTTGVCNTPGFSESPLNGALLPTPVFVEQGTRIGNVGHSGRSSGPHLHMQIKPTIGNEIDGYCAGVSEEILFTEAFAAECDIGASLGTWDALNGENPLEPYTLGGSCVDTSDCSRGETCYDSTCATRTPSQCFLPDAFGPGADYAYIGDASKNIQVLDNAWGATVVTQTETNDYLRLRSYDIEWDGDITPIDIQYEGAVIDYGVSQPIPGTRHAVVSIQGANGNLKHIPYSLNNGYISRMYGQELAEGTVYQVESTTAPTHYGFVVAIEDGSGDLKVIDYDVDLSLNIWRQAHDFVGGPIDEVDITSVYLSDGVVTAEIRPSGQLALRSFWVPETGGVIESDLYESFVFGDSVTVHRVGGFLGLVEFVVTTVVLPDGTLRLDSWEIEADGNIIWVDTQVTGVAASHAEVSPGFGDLVTAVEDSNGDYRMVGWRVDMLTGELRRTATHVDSQVAGAAIGYTGGYLFSARNHPSWGLELYTQWASFDPYK